MAFSDLIAERLFRRPLALPSVPDELRLVPVLGLEQGGADGIRQARVIETNAKIVLRAVAAGQASPTRDWPTNTRNTGAFSLSRLSFGTSRTFVLIVSVDGTGPAAILGGRECADHRNGLTPPGSWLTGVLGSGARGGAVPPRQARSSDTAFRALTKPRSLSKNAPSMNGIRSATDLASP